MAFDRAAPRAVRSQLEEGLRTAIRSGRLEPGEELPSSRELARAIGVSRGSSPSATSSCRVRVTCAVRSDRQPGSPLLR